MSEHQLSILLKLRDEASKQIEQFSQKVQNGMEAAANSLKNFSRQLNKVGTDMTVIGAAITAPLALAFKTTSQYSLEAHESLKRLEDSSRSFQVTIGTALIPVVEKISYLISGLTKWFESLNPQLRDAILQGALITGILFTLSGVLIHVAAKVFDLTARLMAFAAANLPLLAMIAAIATLIIYWDKLRAVALPVINAIESGLSGMGWIALQIVAIFESVFEGISRALSNIFDLLSKIPGPTQGFFKILKGAATGVADDFATTETAIQNMVLKLEDNMTRVYEGANGKIASFVDSGISKINELYNFIANPPKTNINTDDIDAQSVVVAEQRKVDQLRNIWTAWNNEKTRMDMARLQSETEFYNVAIDAQTKAHKSMWTVLGQAKDVFASGISKLFVDMMKGTADAKKFWQDLGWQMIAILVEFAVQKAVNWVFVQAMLAAEVIANTKAAAVVGAAWAGAAAMVSLATFGTNAIPAMAGIAATVGLAQILAVPKMATGGIIDRPTLALIGEAGPEAVIPLNAGRGIGGSSVTHHYYFDLSGSQFLSDELPEKIKRNLAEYVSRVMARGSYN